MLNGHLVSINLTVHLGPCLEAGKPLQQLPCLRLPSQLLRKLAMQVKNNCSNISNVDVPFHRSICSCLAASAFTSASFFIATQGKRYVQAQHPTTTTQVNCTQQLTKSNWDSKNARKSDIASWNTHARTHMETTHTCVYQRREIGSQESKTGRHTNKRTDRPNVGSQ